ncbi:MAG: DUF3048 domain-containing protein [Clostridiales bacterium]|nr:DUF3048 domain-containing protein [Clostridiales bacterium]
MKENFSKWTKRALSIGLSASIMVASVAMFSACTKKSGEEPTSSDENSTTVQVASANNPLTGVSGFNQSAVGKRPYAIVVENHPSARPQWGLCTPDIVLEGLVEGGISRMLWLYADADSIPSKVGPVRSARVDYVESAAAFDAIYVHWGGATTEGMSAYDKIKQLGVNDIDGLSHSTVYFGRDSSRASRGSEHTGYTTQELIKKATTDFNYRTDLKDSYKNIFKFNSEKTALPDAACTNVKTGFSNDYMHTFKYNESDGLYYNYMNSNPMKDENGKQMAVENVLILFASYKVADSIGHVDYDLSGGTGYYISNGTYQQIKWQKGNGGTEPFKFFTQSGEQLSMNPGKFWMGLVPNGMKSATKLS